MPVAWMWPIGYGQIQTSFQAGGITSSAIRARTSAPRPAAVGVHVAEAAPALDPVDPGAGAVARRSRATRVGLSGAGLRRLSARDVAELSDHGHRRRRGGRAHGRARRRRVVAAGARAGAHHRRPRSRRAGARPVHAGLHGLDRAAPDGARRDRAREEGRTSRWSAAGRTCSASSRSPGWSTACGSSTPPRGAGRELPARAPRELDPPPPPGTRSTTRSRSAEQVGDVRLLVSELVTNSLRHAELGPEDRSG